MCLKRLFEREEESRADRDYQTLFRIVKDLDKQGLNKLIEGIECLWKGYDAIRRIKTRDEKEDEKEAKESKPIDDIEQGLLDNFAEVDQEGDK